MIITEHSYEDICAEQDKAKAIRQQIGLTTLVACGMREMMALYHTGRFQGLRFRVGAGTRRLFLEVTLNPKDLYNVTLFRLKRISDLVEMLELMNDISCDILSDVIYKMVNK